MYAKQYNEVQPGEDAPECDDWLHPVRQLMQQLHQARAFQKRMKAFQARLNQHQAENFVQMLHVNERVQHKMPDAMSAMMQEVNARRRSMSALDDEFQDMYIAFCAIWNYAGDDEEEDAV